MSGVSPKISLNSRSHLQHFQRPTSSHFRKDAPSLSRVGYEHVARGSRGRLKIFGTQIVFLFQRCDNAISIPFSIGWARSMGREFVRALLIWMELIQKPVLVGRVSARHPTQDGLPDGRLVLVQDGALQKWACFRCPGGCGEKIRLSLSPKQWPRWEIKLDWLRRPTVIPSVHQLTACRCHFWIKNGGIEWCGDSGRRSA